MAGGGGVGDDRADRDDDEAVPHAADARVVVYSRPGCHLCVQAVAVVAATCAELGIDWTEVDVDAPEHPQLRERFGDEVPVTFVDGRQHDFWRVDPQRLRRALAG
jgi:glutaredoxin